MSAFRSFVIQFLNDDIPEVLSTGQPDAIPLAAHDFTGRTSQVIAPADPQTSYVGPGVQRDLPERVADWLRVVAKILREVLADNLMRADLSSLNNERLGWERHLRHLDALLGYLFVGTLWEKSVEMLRFHERLESLVRLLKDPGFAEDDLFVDDYGNLADP